MKDNLENTPLQFKQIPAFTDNYLWAIVQNHQAWVVDPGDATPFIDLFERENIALKGILITHHHNDHIGGVEKLLAWAKSFVTFAGPLHPSMPRLTRVLQDLDEVELFPQVIARVMAVPGHTLSHLAYYMPQSELLSVPRLYCGDTLFATGCGRLSEGTPTQMQKSLDRFAQLPAETLVCCAHEYTLANIKFALHVDGNNSDLLAWSLQAQALRDQQLPTVPTTIGLEKTVNPFMRSDSPSIIATAQAHSELSLQNKEDVLAVIRKMKDQFK